MFPYLSLLFLLFIPPYTNSPYPISQWPNIIIDIMIYSAKPYHFLAPIFHIFTIILIVLIITLKDKVTRLLNIYFGISFLVFGVFQNIGYIPEYGLAIYWTGIIACFIAAFFCFQEVFIKKSIYSPKNKIISTRYAWMIPFSIFSFWGPSQKIFDPNLFLTSSYGVSFCLTVPVFLTLLMLFYFPNTNMRVLRTISFMGFVMGILNFLRILVGNNFWISIVIHIPLVLISAYCFLISFKETKSN